MRSRHAAIFLRSTGIAIAIAALIDPAFTSERMRAPQMVMVDLSAAGHAAVENRLRGIDPDVVVRAADRRIPCAPDERCVMVADGSLDVDVATDLNGPVSLIAIRDVDEPNVAVQSASTAISQHGSAAGAARVSVDARGMTGSRTAIRATDAGAVIGSVEVEWKSDGTQTVELPWWPVAAGARVLRIEAEPAAGETASFDNAVDLPVTITNTKQRVLVFDARPSWNSTFVRRALEDDPRFIVDHRARVAPALTTGTSAGRLDAATLDALPLLIVGAPDALVANDVDLIDQYVRVRGGSVILLPERVPAGASARLFAGEWSEQLVAEPETFGALRATELLRPRAPAFGASPISPVVIASPAGQGRIIVSGAMDAWRYRAADATAFDRFWTSLAAGSAALGEVLRVEFDDALVSPGIRAPFTVRHRAMTLPASFEASAVARCGAPSPVAQARRAPADQIRLWPAGTPGVFSGTLPIANAASCSIEVTINGTVATAAVAIAAALARPAIATLAKLERAALASGGVVTDEDNLDPIRALNNVLPRSSEATPVHPMRSPWWLLPFVGCLSAEWWLRRRNGLA